MVILYSTHCPKCCVLEKKMKQKNITYKVVDNILNMESKGIDTVPVLEVEGRLFSYKEANDYVNTLQQEDGI